MPVRYSFLATDFKTGVVLADLPELIVPSFKTTMGRYEAITAELPLATAPDDWERFTLHGGAVINLISQNVDTYGNLLGPPIPIGGAVIVSRKRTHGETVQLSLATLEAYFDRRMVGDEAYVSVDQNLVVQDLIQTYVESGPNGGPDFRVEILGGAGPVISKEYKGKDDKSIYSILTDLMSDMGGPEWYIGWEWKTDPQRITPVVYVGSRIGNPVQPGMSPLTTFEMPGSILEFEYVEDYSSDYGANSVTAVSSGQGDTRPESDEHSYEDSFRPTFEYVWSPATSITDISQLNSYASGALESMKDGSAALSLSISGYSGPQLGVDWSIGDDVGFQIGGREELDIVDEDGFVAPLLGMHVDSDGFYSPGPLIEDADHFFYLKKHDSTVPSFPDGISGTARVVAWEIDLREPVKVIPTLVLN